MNFDTLAKRLERIGDAAIQLAAPLARLLQAPFGTPQEMRQALFAYCAQMESKTESISVPTSELTARLREMGNYLKEHIRSTEWVCDGDGNHWFNSYYDDSGNPVEGIQDGDVRMMLTGQVFALMSGTAGNAQAQQIVNAAKTYLRDPLRGGYCLNTDFHEVKLDMGRMFGFAYGTKENGAVFCHMAVMYAYALYSRGFAKEGWEVLELLLKQCMDFEKSKVLPGIPEYFDDRGQGMYPYLTGSGSWLLLTLQTQVFGVRGENGALTLNPQLSKCHFDESGTAQIRCHSAGAELLVRYHNPNLLDAGQYRVGNIRMDGREVSLPLTLPKGEAVTLDVTLVPYN